MTIASKGKIHSAVKRATAVIAATIAVLMVSACGAQGQVNQAQTATSPLEELKVGSGSAVSTLSVNQEAGSANYQLAALYQEGLLSLDVNGKLKPALAESWESKDNKTWVFNLRKGVKFHDGTNLTADDVVFSLNLARDAKKSPGLSVYFPSYVKDIKATSDSQITITLDTPHSDFGQQVSNSGGGFITSKKFYESAKNYGSSSDLIVGTGPYKVTEFDPSSHVTLEKFNDYWGKNDGPKKVTVQFITDDATRLLAFQDGKIDVSLSVPITQIDQWTKSGAKATYYADRSYKGLTFDQGVAPFDDVNVRKAVAYALDKEGVVDGVLKGHGTAATGIDSPDQLAGWVGLDKAKEEVAKLPALNYDLDKAKAALKASKVPNGFTTTLTYPTGYPEVGQASLALADSLKKIGITLNVKEQPLEQWLSEVGNGKQGVAWMIYNPTTAQPNEITTWLFAADGAGANPANWSDKQVAAKTAEIGTLTDKQKQFDDTLDNTATALKQVIYAPGWWGQAAVVAKSGIQTNTLGSYTFATNWAASFAKQS